MPTLKGTEASLYNVSCMLYLQEMSFISHGWIPSGQTICVCVYVCVCMCIYIYIHICVYVYIFNFYLGHK